MRISRRGFLKGTLAGATLACSIVDLKAFCQGINPTNRSPSPKPSNLDLPKIKGKIVVPGDKSYNEDRRNYNARFDVAPNSILFCSNESDVIESVKWARRNKIPVALRS